MIVGSVRIQGRGHTGADGRLGENTRRYQVVSIGGNDVPEDSPFLIEAALSVAEVLRGER
jgi:hypothetical protein